ncbi:MAG TPA: hypothetical protein PKE27_08550 [Povalibacter sp.]|uniref:hypothetical protein n=1 Tax=Povalibacter sp. TaxID=1962978 RepID=UPI002C2EEBC1|nr:hypothetical protein [Povalibacter sp.]HMN44607.1 hypothetical protein [Povalibacter sp.]
MFRTDQASRVAAYAQRRGRMALLLLLLTPLGASADRFDIASFEAPAGWSRKERADGLVFESRQVGSDSVCLMTVSRGYSATASLREELDRAWTAVMEGRTFADDPETPAPLDIGNGVTIARRIAPVQTPKGISIAALNLLRKGDRLVLVLVSVSDGEAWDRCGNVHGDFLASMQLDMTMPLTEPAALANADSSATHPDSTVRPDRLPAQGGPDPQMAAKFNHSVVGEWQWVLTTITWGPAPVKFRHVFNIRFERDGKYRIASQNVPTETGTYRLDGQRILMRPTSGADYVLDWYFGTHPEASANWGLILRSNVDWAAGDTGEWRAFKPPE